MGKNYEEQVETSLAKSVGSGVGKVAKVFAGRGPSLCISLYPMLQIYKVSTTGVVALCADKPSPTDVRNGWWANPIAQCNHFYL